MSTSQQQNGDMGTRPEISRWPKPRYDTSAVGGGDLGVAGLIVNGYRELEKAGFDVDNA